MVRQLYYAVIYSRIKYEITFYVGSSASDINYAYVQQHKLLK